MKMNKRRVPRVSRMVSEWFREVPNGLGSVRNASGHIWKVLEGPEGPEGYGRFQDDPGCLRESGRFHNRCNHVALVLKEFA